MSIEFRWPILGFVIPFILIFSISYGSHYFILRYHLSLLEQVLYQSLVCMIWISYAMAIFTSPGHPPSNYTPKPDEWKRFCKKCGNFKPPRTHHCSKCNKCVLQMDHHCPWTLNCVGHNNLPQFMRFLFWVIFGTSYLLVQLSYRIVDYYRISEMPIYLIRRAELASVIVFTVLDVFVLLTISLLFIRCVLNLAKGMTQIEVWEWERLESQFHSRRLWMQIRSNYEKVFGKKLPKLSTWTNATLEEEDVDEEEVEVDEEDEVEEEKEKKEYPPEWSESELDAEAKDKRKEGKDSDIHLQESPKRSSSSENLNKETEPTVVPTNFTIDDIIFPYDYGVYGNLKAALGSPLFWLIPWKGSRRNGYDMELSKDYKEYDQLGLPWPPDGCYKELSVGDQFHIKRSQWQNDMGEGLNDFGVETDVEDDEEQ